MAEDWHKLISQLQYDIQLEEDVWVPMRDGVVWEGIAEIAHFPGLRD